MRQHNGGQTLETTPVILAAGLQGGPAELSSTFSQDLNHIASTRCGNPQEMQFQGDLPLSLPMRSPFLSLCCYSVERMVRVGRACPES